MNARHFATATLWIIGITGLCAIAAAASMCGAEAKNRPPTSIHLVDKPPRNSPTILFDAPLRGGTHYRPRVVPTPLPEPKPVLVISETIYINTHHQDDRALAINIVRDIRKSGGLTAGYRYKAGVGYDIDATIPAQYIDRIEPLMRKDRGHINSHYAEWSRYAAANPPTRYDIQEQPTTISLNVKGRYFDKGWEGDTIRLLYIFGIVMTVGGFFGAAVLTWGD